MAEKLNLLDIHPEQFRTGVFNPAGAILTWLENEDAYWKYKGEPSPDRPHAELSGDGCSNGFIDMPSILQYPYICEILGKELARLLKRNGVRADFVVSSPYSAITLGHEVAKELEAIFRHPIKDPSDAKQKKMLWRGKPIPAGSWVLQVEELVTTASTLIEVRRSVEEGCGEQLMWNYGVGTLVHRPAKISPMSPHSDHMWVVSLLEKEMQNFTENCPYCAVGSKKLRPRQSPQNWAALTSA